MNPSGEYGNAMNQPGAPDDEALRWFVRSNDPEFDDWAGFTAWLERKAGHELDQRFGPRLDRQSRAAERAERKIDALTEMLGLFIQHQLTLVAHQPAFDPDTAQLGRLRYQRFMELVERRLERTSRQDKLPAPNQKEDEQ